MNNPAQILIKLCQQYLQGQLTVNEYIFAFDEAYYENQTALPEPVLSIFDEIYTANELFEPNNEIRKEDASYLDEARLYESVKKSLAKIDSR